MASVAMWLYYFVAGVIAHMFMSRVFLNNDRRDTPLHIACRKGNVKTVKYLLDRGADPNVFNFFRETPLLLACAADSSVIVKMLLDRNADSNDRAARAARAARADSSRPPALLCTSPAQSDDD